MTTPAPATDAATELEPLFSPRNQRIARAGVWKENPIFCQILGICSALAVTNRLSSAIVMSCALMFVLMGSNVLVSLLRHYVPRRTRMIVEVAIIATFVIVVDQLLKAFWYDMSKELGPYVGLIITNCIVMGRAEGFALQNKPWPSLLDAVGNGLGYAFVLISIAIPREILGTGSILAGMVGDEGQGIRVLPQAYENNQVMIMAPGAFIMLGVLLWILRTISPQEEQP